MTHPITTVGLQLAGYSIPAASDMQIFDRIRDLARLAEQSGFDSIWTMDHLQQIQSVGGADEPILEAYTTLAALAAVTDSASLGVLVTCAGFRNPALLAKMVTSIDIISHGRALLGIGAGWHREEHESCGLPFPDAIGRLRRLEEAVTICRLMFTEYLPTYRGKYYEISDAVNMPRPARSGGPPILIGGGGERVLIPMVARLGDACNFFGTPAIVQRRIGLLRDACEAAGRDAREISKTWLGVAILSESATEVALQVERLGRQLGVSPRAARALALAGSGSEVQQQVAAYRGAGVDGIIVAVLDPGDSDHISRLGALLRTEMGSIN